MLSGAKHLTAEQGGEILRCAQDDKVGASNNAGVRGYHAIYKRMPTLGWEEQCE